MAAVTDCRYKRMIAHLRRRAFVARAGLLSSNLLLDDAPKPVKDLSNVQIKTCFA
jgi:hypothetical protein